MAMAPCPALDCGQALGLWTNKGIDGGLRAPPGTPYYRHIQKYVSTTNPVKPTPADPHARARSVDAHALVVAAHGGSITDVCRAGFQVCVDCPALPPASSLGAQVPNSPPRRRAPTQPVAHRSAPPLRVRGDRGQPEGALPPPPLC
eukprot:scaffold479_cov119-Isochrysis_galbana.AAC.7